MITDYSDRRKNKISNCHVFSQNVPICLKKKKKGKAFSILTQFFPELKSDSKPKQ